MLFIHLNCANVDVFGEHNRISSTLQHAGQLERCLHVNTREIELEFIGGLGE